MLYLSDLKVPEGVEIPSEPAANSPVVSSIMLAPRSRAPCGGSSRRGRAPAAVAPWPKPRQCEAAAEAKGKEAKK